MRMWSFLSIWKQKERYREERNRSCICREKGISRKDVSTRRTGEGCTYPGSVRGIPAGLPMMTQEQLSVIRAITVSVHSRMEKVQECLGILAARCASCNCMTYFYCAPLQSCRRLYQLGGDWLPPLILACFSPPIGESHLPTDIYNLFTIFIAIVIFNVSRETYISIACLYQKSHTLQYKTINN